MPGVLWVENVPAAIARIDRNKIVGEPVPGRHRSVVLSAAAKNQRISLRDVHVVKHRDGQAVAPVGPRCATILADIYSTIVGAVHASCGSGGH